VLGRHLLSYNPGNGERRDLPLPCEIGSVAERDGGGLIAGVTKGIAFIDFDQGDMQMVLELEQHLPTNRFNDGKVDAKGRFWAGTMDFDCDKPSGALYRIAADLTHDCADEGYLCTNGPAWSLDGTIMYHTDTMKRSIYAFDFDANAGSISGKRAFVEFTDDDGYPDGMTVDAEDHLWVAHWGGGRVTRFRPDGSVERVIPLPVPYVTSCAFGGKNLHDLYITTATLPMSDDEKAAQPLAGGLFRTRPGVAGVAAHLFAG
jgi:sugar lactone lactonase YvrE